MSRPKTPSEHNDNLDSQGDIMLDNITSMIAGPLNALTGADAASGAEGASSGGLLGGLLGGGGFTDILSIGGLGTMAESFLDGLGLPDWAGDLARMFTAASTGDIPGALGGYLDAMEDAFEDIGLPEVGAFVKKAGDMTSTFGGMATGGAPGSDGLDASTLSAVMGDDADINALGALLGIFGDDTASSAAGSVRV
jgi:hypothetical protein